MSWSQESVRSSFNIAHPAVHAKVPTVILKNGMAVPPDRSQNIPDSTPRDCASVASDSCVAFQAALRAG